MAISEEQIQQIRDELESCKNPLFLFDDDQDGICSYLQLYRLKGEGKGVIVKTTPKIGTVFLNKVIEHRPDKIFILDISDVEQEFIDEAKVPIVWIAHHGPYKRHNIKYFNPRVSKWEDNHPTSYMCWQVAQKDIWIAALGCVADWFMPDFLEDFRKQYPDLIDKDYKKPGDIIYNTKLGELIKMVSFMLKGATSDVNKCIKAMSRIKHPNEILNQESEEGRMIYKKYTEVNKIYDPLIKEVRETAEKSKGKIILFKYKDDKTSFTSDLSNELIYRHPDKIVIIAREKNEEMKCSLRSAKINLKPIVEKCLVGLNGYGGGHEYACGLNLKKHDFEEFLRRFEEML